jgi:hypothetical protein
MKLLSLLFLTLFLGRGCESDSKQDLNSAIIEYVANTRGFYQKVILDKHMVTISNDRKGKEKAVQAKISEEDWTILVDAFQEINLEELKDLKSPTEKRLYDGAAIAHLKITYNGNIYESQSFDHGFPPYEIKKLVSKINSFAKQNNEN